MDSSPKPASTRSPLVRRALRIGALILFFVIGIGFGFLTGPDLTALAGKYGGSLTLIQVVLIPIATLLSILVVHELGHLIVSLLVGFRFVMFAVGPLKIYADGQRLRLTFTRKLSVAGMSLCVPRRDGPLRRRVAAIILAGPFANLSLAALVGIVFLLRLRVDLAGALFLAGLGFLSGLIGILNLLPTTSKGFTSDGRRAWDLLRNTPQARRWLALWTLIATTAGGTRPAAQDPDLITRALALPDDSLDHITALTWAFYAALDQGNWDEARLWLAEVQERMDALPDSVQAGYLLEMAYFAAAVDHDAATARALLTRAKHPLVPSASSQARAEAAILLAEGQPGPAIQRAQEALDALERDYTPGLAVAEREWLTALIATAREAVV